LAPVGSLCHSSVGDGPHDVRAWWTTDAA